MSTEAQIAANRLNAQQSTGPVTPEGKAAAARNNFRHGFRSATFILSELDEAEHNSILRDLITHHEPGDLTEHRHVREMADAEFRLRRCREQMEIAMKAHIETIRSRYPESDQRTLETKAIETLRETGCSWYTWQRYESKYDRQYERAHKALQQYRKGPSTAELERQVDLIRAREDAGLMPVGAFLDDRSPANPNRLHHQPISEAQLASSVQKAESTRPATAPEGNEPAPKSPSADYGTLRAGQNAFEQAA